MVTIVRKTKTAALRFTTIKSSHVSCCGAPVAGSRMCALHAPYLLTYLLTYSLTYLLTYLWPGHACALHAFYCYFHIRLLACSPTYLLTCGRVTHVLHTHRLVEREMEDELTCKK